MVKAVEIIGTKDIMIKKFIPWSISVNYSMAVPSMHCCVTRSTLGTFYSIDGKTSETVSKYEVCKHVGDDAYCVAVGGLIFFLTAVRVCSEKKVHGR